MITIVAVILALTVIPAPWGVAAVVAAATVDVAETLFMMRWSRRKRAAVGLSALVGRTATVVHALDPVGQVRIDGELWRARSVDPPAPAGISVVVRAVEGLELEVTVQSAANRDIHD